MFKSTVNTNTDSELSVDEDEVNLADTTTEPSYFTNLYKTSMHLAYLNKHLLNRRRHKSTKTTVFNGPKPLYMKNAHPGIKIKK